MMRLLTTNLGRPLVLAGLAATLALAGGGKVQADFISIVRPATVGTSTGNATTVSPVALTSAATGESNQYINNVGGPANAFGSTGNVRTVGVDLLGNYLDSSKNFVAAATYNGNPIAAVFALSGQIGAGGTYTIDPTMPGQGGRVALFQLPGGVASFRPFNPTTWGATTGSDGTLAFSTANLIAAYDVKPREPVFDSNDGSSPNGMGTGTFTALSDPSKVNQIGVTTTSASQTGSGFFLFIETANTRLQLAELSPLNTYETINVQTVPPSPEGAVSRVTEDYVPYTQAVNGLSTDGFNALNLIAGNLGMGFFGDLDGPNTAFADTLGMPGNAGGDPRDFNPANSMGSPNTADEMLSLETTSSFTIELATMVPEPASLTMLLCGGLATAGVFGMRRFRMK